MLSEKIAKREHAPTRAYLNEILHCRLLLLMRRHSFGDLTPTDSLLRQPKRPNAFPELMEDIWLQHFSSVHKQTSNKLDLQDLLFSRIWPHLQSSTNQKVSWQLKDSTSLCLHFVDHPTGLLGSEPHHATLMVCLSLVYLESDLAFERWLRFICLLMFVCLFTLPLVRSSLWTIPEICLNRVKWLFRLERTHRRKRRTMKMANSWKPEKTSKSPEAKEQGSHNSWAAYIIRGWQLANPPPLGHI